jgi:hypothetical protein
MLTMRASANADQPVSQSLVQARRAEVARRYRRRKRDRPLSMSALRIAELRRLFAARYGDNLPDDDAGRDEALVMAHHLVHRSGDPCRRIAAWLELQAPWMAPAEVAQLITTVLSKPLRWRADKLAVRLNLTDMERRRLRITTIGATDKTKAERLVERVRPRVAYEATSVARAKPWLRIGISRATWYRRRRHKASARKVNSDETSPCTA